MDTSEQYIKMCEKAGEIQRDKGMYRDGDYFLDNDEAICWCECCYCDDTKSLGLIWLPRQDQLQEMVERDICGLVEGIANFYFPFDDLGCMPHPSAQREVEELDKYVKQFTSMEQLWLAFVMKENHNKIWDGEKWLII